ncbi:Scr1 family TA system antitoxin-like transcriptional regulator [Streptomyces sp. NPDC047061]|uniref:Scr1 family TA system antitoxin-like transcriptional regulator n=1 Tax=Streptomyces sp. NPDC047061 TaxID=3154605 RepID=UPI003406C803
MRFPALPFAVGLHPLLDGTLRLMWFDDQPPLAYTEGHGTGKVHDSPSVVRELQHRYDLALSDARPLDESLALLRATAKEYRHHD